MNLTLTKDGRLRANQSQLLVGFALNGLVCSSLYSLCGEVSGCSFRLDGGANGGACVGERGYAMSTTWRGTLWPLLTTVVLPGRYEGRRAVDCIFSPEDSFSRVGTFTLGDACSWHVV
jgi:hypothetical protein